MIVSGILVEAIEGNPFTIGGDILVHHTTTKMRGDNVFSNKVGKSLNHELERRMPYGGSYGEYVITNAYNLKNYKNILHIITPIWTGREPNTMRRDLNKCYAHCIGEALRMEASTIVFPNILIGPHKFLLNEALEIVLQSIYENILIASIFSINKISLEKITFAINNSDYSIFIEELNKMGKKIGEDTKN